MAHLRGTLPDHLVLWGIEPETIALGMRLSSVIAAKMPALKHAVMDELARWGIEPVQKTASLTTAIASTGMN